jgi:hypothetical protein
MNNDLLILLSKFAVAARKVIGPVNPAKIINDRAYANAIFERINAEADETQLVLALDLQNQLGMLGASESKKTTDPASNKTHKKYMFGPRG